MNKYWTTKQLNIKRTMHKKKKEWKQEKPLTQETVPFVVSQLQAVLDTNHDLAQTNLSYINTLRAVRHKSFMRI